MKKAVRIQSRAGGHLADAYDWYEAQRPGLGMEFLDAVEACLNRIVENPQLYPVLRDAIRRAGLRRFPYPVFYVPEPDEVVVLAVLHAGRDPRRRP